MCRMLGMVSTGIGTERGAAEAAPLPSWQHLVGASHSLRRQAAHGAVAVGDTNGHDDSWGIGWFDAAGQISLLRQTGSAMDSAYFVLGAETAARYHAGSGPATVLLGHLRKASCGAVNSENAHPVRVPYGEKSARTEFLLSHNGTIRRPLLETLYDDLHDSGRSEAASDSDTVVLAGWLGYRAETAESVFESVADSLWELLQRAERIAPDGDITKMYSALNLLIAAPEGLIVLRQFSKEPEYYTLSARALTPDESTTGGWIIASEPTDDNAAWEPLLPGILTLFPVERDHPIRRLVVAGK